ncbi:unnamed protein product [Gemmataceae bacterium]|nr:unnamed protein product [Gemmataceae bacterium]VTU02364.1 unnamed protein product [Gemmataceae bacterium]
MGIFWIILAIVIISTVVGAVSKLINGLNEMNNAPRARGGNPRAANPPANRGAAGARQANSDMDRFLAEIDRLRKKSGDAPQPQQNQNQAPVVPVVQPVKAPERSRSRVTAELAEAPPPRADGGFTQYFPAAAPAATARPAELAMLQTATVVAPASSTGAPATRVTRLATRPRPAAKTPLAKNLTALLNSGQGLAMAIVLQEVLGPPKSKKNSSE